MRVNSDTKVANLNSDKLDGLDSTEIGVNGLERVRVSNASNSDSSKSVFATCPSGKVVVGTGFDIFGGKSDIFPDHLINVVIDQVFPEGNRIFAAACEEEPISDSWAVEATAICAKAGTP
jgi:hypothetical protein